MNTFFNYRQLRALVPFFAASFVGCPACKPPEAPEASRPPRAQKWLDRAWKEYRSVEIDAAQHSAQQALEIVPQDAEIKLLAARVALARLLL